jgi:hypothetical protein
MTSTAPTASHDDGPTKAMRKGRQTDSARRRQRVLAALEHAATEGTEISVSAIASTAGVDRSFLYRHRDLLGQIHAHQATPPAAARAPGPGVTRASLHADLLAAGERAVRLTGRIRQLETACPKHSASRPGTSPVSAPPSTSTPSTRRSSTSNNKASNYAYGSASETRTSLPREPPTANSWLSSRLCHDAEDTPRR